MPYYNETATDKIRNLIGEAGNTAKTIASHIDNKNGTSLASKQLQLQRAQYLQDLDNKVYSTSAKKALTGIEAILYGNSKTGAVGFFETQLNDMNYEGYEANTQSMLDNTLTVEYLAENFGMSEGHASKFIEEYGDTITSEATQRTQTNMWLSMTNQLGTDQNSFVNLAVSKGGSWHDVFQYIDDHYKSTGGTSWDVSRKYDTSSNEVKVEIASSLGVTNAKNWIDENITNPDINYEDLLNGGLDEWITVLSDADDGTSNIFQAVIGSGKDTLKAQLIEYIAQQAGIATKVSADKQTGVNSFLATATINSKPVSREEFDKVCEEAGLSADNSFDKAYMEESWLQQATRNAKYEAEAKAQEEKSAEEQRAAISNRTKIEADNLRDEATILESQGDYLTAAPKRITASDSEYDILIEEYTRLGMPEEEITALKNAKQNAAENILKIAELKVIELDGTITEEQAKELEKREKEQRQLDAAIKESRAQTLDNEAALLESEGRYEEAGKKRADASDIRFEVAEEELIANGATEQQLTDLRTDKNSSRTTLEQSGTNKQTDYNNKVAAQSREDKFNRYTSAVDDVSMDIQMAMLSTTRNVSTLYTDKNGEMAGYYTVINEDGTIEQSDNPIINSISEWMFKNGEGVTSISTQWWPIVEEQAKNLGAINPDGTIADIEGVALIAARVNQIGYSVTKSTGGGSAASGTSSKNDFHTDAYTVFMNHIYYDETLTNDEVKVYRDRALDERMSIEEYESIDISKRDLPAIGRMKTLTSNIKAYFDVIDSNSGKNDSYNTTYGKYLVDFDKALEKSLYTWCVNNPNATPDDIQKYAEQVATDIMYEDFYKGLENDIDIVLRNANILDKSEIEYITNKNVDDFYDDYLHGEATHLIRPEIIDEFKTSMAGNVYSDEDDLFNAMASRIYEKPYEELNTYEKSIVMANSAICVKEQNLYNETKAIPESIDNRKVAEVFVEGYGISTLDEKGFLYSINPYTGKVDIRYLGEGKYSSVISGTSRRIAVDPNLPVVHHTPAAPKAIVEDTGYGYSDIYDVYNTGSGTEAGVSTTNIITEGTEMVVSGINNLNEDAKENEFSGVDVGTDIGSPYEIYNTGSGADSGMGQGFGWISKFFKGIFSNDKSKPETKPKEKEIDIVLIGKLESLKGGN